MFSSTLRSGLWLPVLLSSSSVIGVRMGMESKDSYDGSFAWRQPNEMSEDEDGEPTAEDTVDAGMMPSGGGSCRSAPPLEPPIPGAMPGQDRPHLILAQDVDYPPYATLGSAADDFPVSGFGADFAAGLQGVCDIDITMVQTQWSRCWGSDRIGEGLALGEWHGCSTYYHGSGVRNRYLEFSDPILDDKKAAGILTRLNEDGTPVVDGLSNLDGVRVVDVVGFAPSADNLAIVLNECTGELFTGYEIVPPTSTTDFPNDDALRTVLNGDADAMWVFADQALSSGCSTLDNVNQGWDCTIWDGLGTTFAYIQTGMFGWATAGTTFTIAKKGAGVAPIVNPCIEAFVQTEEYYNICVKYDLVSDCFVNEYFPTDFQTAETPPYNIPADELTTSCSDGYCACPAL